MQRLPHEQLRAWLGDSSERPPDLGQLAKLRKDAAKEFCKQLTIGFPTDQDEAGLKGQGELNVDVLDGDAAAKLNQWFIDRWDDSRALDISDALAALAALVTQLHRDDRLVVVNLHEATSRDPHILCSLGLA